MLREHKRAAAENSTLINFVQVQLPYVEVRERGVFALAQNGRAAARAVTWLTYSKSFIYDVRDLRRFVVTSQHPTVFEESLVPSYLRAMFVTFKQLSLGK